jgi:hypothetical protein
LLAVRRVHDVGRDVRGEASEHASVELARRGPTASRQPLATLARIGVDYEYTKG